MNQKEIKKLVGLGAVILLVSVFGWWMLRSVFSDLQLSLAIPGWGVLINFILSLLILLLVLALYGVVSALESRNWFKLALGIILPLSLMAMLGVSIYTLIGAVIWLAGLIQFGYKVREERQERLKVSINKYLRHGLGLAISATILAISISFYGTVVDQGTEKMDPIDVLSRVASNGANQALAIQVPGYDPNMSLDEFMLLLFATKLNETKAAEDNSTQSDSFFGVDLSGVMENADDISTEDLKALLPPDFEEKVKDNPEYITDVYEQIKNELIIMQLAEVRDELLKTLNIEAEGTDSVGSVVEKAVHVQLDDIFSPFKYLIPPILALTLYFALQIFGFLYVWIARLLAIIVFGILKMAKMFKIEEEVKKAQVIKLV